MNMTNQPPWTSLVRLIQQLLGTSKELIMQKIGGLRHSLKLAPHSTMEWSDLQTEHVTESIQRAVIEQERLRSINCRKTIALEPSALSRKERQVIQHIERTVTNLNRSNLTRTTAYFRIYESYPELHWALLAHMVSRNGGWNMTDLKGDYIEGVMNREDRHWSYRLLERCNAKIFHDAFPQLMLYAESRRLGRSLFHLLPQFHVSVFMKPIWDSFWVQPNSPLLSVALIINEQHVIEGSVVHHPDYQQKVIDHFNFKAHGWLQMNQVVFPTSSPLSHAPTPLVGLTLEKFQDLSERIEFGKQLYALLFHTEHVLEGALRFARSTPHTGSRADYWPNRFTDRRHSAGCSSMLIYSPKLNEVYQDERHAPLEQEDWLQNDDALKYLNKPTAPLSSDMTSLHERMWDELASLYAWNASKKERETK